MKGMSAIAVNAIIVFYIHKDLYQYSEIMISFYSLVKWPNLLLGSIYGAPYRREYPGTPGSCLPDGKKGKRR